MESGVVDLDDLNNIQILPENLGGGGIVYIIGPMQ